MTSQCDSKKQRLWALFFFNNYESQNSNFLIFVTYLADELSECNFWSFLIQTLMFVTFFKKDFYIQTHIHLNTKGLKNASIQNQYPESSALPGIRWHCFDTGEHAICTSSTG
jgi:hypothetical protein